MSFPREAFDSRILVASEALNVVDKNAQAVVVLREGVFPLKGDVGLEMVAVDVMNNGGCDEGQQGAELRIPTKLSRGLQNAVEAPSADAVYEEADQNALEEQAGPCLHGGAGNQKKT
jgi:hypothetical protein